MFLSQPEPTWIYTIVETPLFQTILSNLQVNFLKLTSNGRVFIPKPQPIDWTRQ